jgi:hypothetical protein
MGSVSGRILLGLLDVIRCGLQKYRVFRVLKSLKQNVCTDLNVSVRYDYFPSKMKKKILNTLQNGDIENGSCDTSNEMKCGSDDNHRNDSDGKKMIKVETEIREEKEGKENDEDKKGKEEKEDISGDDKIAPNTDLEKDKTTEMKEGAEVAMKEEVKDEVKDGKTNTIIEDVKTKLLKAKKEKEEKIRTVKKDFMTEFLLSETVDFFITLPDCCLLISATSRYGFQLKSVISNEAFDRFPSFMEHYNNNNNEGVADALKTDKMNEIKTTIENSKYSQRHCDSLYHPMSVRLDRTQELVRSLDCLVMGSCVR